MVCTACRAWRSLVLHRVVCRKAQQGIPQGKAPLHQHHVRFLLAFRQEFQAPAIRVCLRQVRTRGSRRLQRRSQYRAKVRWGGRACRHWEEGAHGAPHSTSKRGGAMQERANQMLHCLQKKTRMGMSRFRRLVSTIVYDSLGNNRNNQSCPRIPLEVKTFPARLTFAFVFNRAVLSAYDAQAGRHPLVPFLAARLVHGGIMHDLARNYLLFAVFALGHGMKKRAWYKEMACASSICVKYGGTAIKNSEVYRTVRCKNYNVSKDRDKHAGHDILALELVRPVGSTDEVM